MKQIDYSQVQSSLREVLKQLPNPEELEAMQPGNEKQHMHSILEDVMGAMWHIRSHLTGKSIYELWDELS